MADYSIIGKWVPRTDGKAKVTGRAKYTVDTYLPGMLYAKILRCPYPHAKIVSIDTSKAEALLGVEAVLTGQDTKGVRFAFVDTPRYPADEQVLVEDKARFAGDGVAAVAAIREDIAEEALDLIDVEYELLGQCLPRRSQLRMVLLKFTGSLILVGHVPGRIGEFPPRAGYGKQ